MNINIHLNKSFSLILLNLISVVQNNAEGCSCINEWTQTYSLYSLTFSPFHKPTSTVRYKGDFVVTYMRPRTALKQQALAEAVGATVEREKNISRGLRVSMMSSYHSMHSRSGSTK